MLRFLYCSGSAAKHERIKVQAVLSIMELIVAVAVAVVVAVAVDVAVVVAVAVAVAVDVVGSLYCLRCRFC